MELSHSNETLDKVLENDFENNKDTENISTDITIYKEIDEPCVALTIIGENRLTNVEAFVKRGFKFSFKTFFSTLVLTIMNMFI